MSNWISVDERLPEENEEVLAWDGESIEKAHLQRYLGGYNDNTLRWTYYDCMIWENVTHWMPLPEPPESKNE